MQDDHLNSAKCNCYDCSDYKGNHVDQGYGEDDEKLSYYLDSTLIAKKPAKIYSLPGATLPGSKLLRTVKPGETIGILDSWVKDKKNPNGTWIMLTKRGGYLFLVPGLFDKEKAVETSSGKKQVEKIKKLEDIAKKDVGFSLPTLDMLGQYKWIIILAIIAITTAVFLRVKG